MEHPIKRLLLLFNILVVQPFVNLTELLFCMVSEKKAEARLQLKKKSRLSKYSSCIFLFFTLNYCSFFFSSFYSFLSLPTVVKNVQSRFNHIFYTLINAYFYVPRSFKGLVMATQQKNMSFLQLHLQNSSGFIQ